MKFTNKEKDYIIHIWRGDVDNWFKVKCRSKLNHYTKDNWDDDIHELVEDLKKKNKKHNEINRKRKEIS